MAEAEQKGGWAGQVARWVGLKPQQAGLIRIAAVGLAVGILFMNAGPLFGVDTGTPPPSDAAAVSARALDPADELGRLEAEMAHNLEQTLSAIAGAGPVRVTVMLESGPSIAVVADSRVDRTTTKETAADNSTRETVTANTTITHVLTKSGSNDSPAVMNQSRAQIAGVLIVAGGAGSDRVRARLHEAAVTALGISPNRITVVAASGRE